MAWFGGALPGAALERTAAAVQAADLLFVLGPSAVVCPVAGLPDRLRPGIPLIEINPDPTPLAPRATLAVRAPADAFLSPLLDALPSSSA